MIIKEKQIFVVWISHLIEDYEIAIFV